MNFPTIVCVCSAHRDQGKTQLVIRLVKGLTEEGFEVGTMKHIGGESSFDSPNAKDTVRHAEAGSKLVVAVTKEEIITLTRAEEPTLENALKKFPESLDFIIVEGFKKSSYPRFLIIDKAEEIKGLDETGPVLGITGYIADKKEEIAKLDEKYPVLDEKNGGAFVSIIKQHRLKSITSNLPGTNCGDCGFQSCEEMAENILFKKVSFDKCPHISKLLTLRIDGKEIYMKDFVQNIICKGIEGAIQTLKGVPRNPQKIVIEIAPTEK